MHKATEIRDFGYRNPRYPFPKMVDLEISQGASSRVIATHGIDISVDGIALATDLWLNPIEPVMVAIPLADGSLARVRSRVLCQADDQCRFAFEFATAEQRAQIEELIAEFAVFQ
jgi:hypothetical protein